MSKRTFGFDTTSLSTAAPLLPDGYYAGIITNASVTRKKDNVIIPNIRVVEEFVYKDGERVATGDYIISGWLNFNVDLTSKKAIKILQRDTPRIFGGMINLSFDKKTLCLKDNYALGKWLETLELNEIDFQEQVDFGYDEAIAVPEELEHVPNIVDMLNSVQYQLAMFSVICEAANNLPVIAAVISEPNYKDKEQLDNVLNMGSASKRSCGILPYTEGSENDLDDEEE